MAVVPVHAPRLQNAVDKPLMTRPTDVIYYLVPTIFDQRGSYLCGYIVKHLIPCDALPFARPARPFPPHRVEYAVNVVDLIDRRRTFRTIAAAAPGVIRITLKFADPHCALIDIAQQSTARFAVKAGRRDDHVVLFFALLPTRRLVFRPIVPFLRRRIVREIARFDDRRQCFILGTMKIRDQAQLFGDRLDK